MVIVDSTVWIDFLKGRETAQVEKFEELIAEETDVFTTGIIIQEVLSGIRSRKERGEVRTEFGRFLTVMPTIDTHVQAAEIFDACQKRGYTIRSAIDCLISALAIGHDLVVLENDRDYEFISRVVPLKTFKHD